MTTHISKTVSNCFSAMRLIRSVRRSVSKTVLLSLVTALVLSRVNYSNATLAGLPARQLCRLQSVLHAVPGSWIMWHHYSVNSIGFEFRNRSPSSCRASSSGLSTAQHLCISLTASTAQPTSPWGEVCIPVHQRRSLFQ